MLEYNRADFPQAVAYATQALKRAHALNKNPQCGQASLIRASAYERQGQYQQAEEDFWRAVWSGNSKAGGYYGWHDWRRVMVTSTLVWIFANKVFVPAQPIRKCFACIICCWC